MRWFDMALTDAKVKAAKVLDGKKRSKLVDGFGLYLLVDAKGHKYWRYDYRFAGKRKTLAIGVYPNISLKEARTKRIEARSLLDRQIDPNQQKSSEKHLAVRNNNALTFEVVAREFIEKQSLSWSSGYKHDCIRRLEKHIFPWLGKCKVIDIKPPHLLSCLDRVVSLGIIEAAHKTRMLCGQVFRYAIAIGICEYDPTQALRGALPAKNSNNRAHVMEPKAIGSLMRAIHGFEGTFVVQCALKLSPLVFVRPGELRQAEWCEIDLDKREWRIPAHKMKMRALHVVPLSKQAISILEDIYPLTGDGKYVFPSIRSRSRPMSENTINNALQRIGYDTKTEHCAHGFRGMASSTLHELGYVTDIIERQLAHKEGNRAKGAYDHARHLPARVDMMQFWADYLDELREETSLR